MTLRQLKWLTVVGPVLFLILLDLARHRVSPDLFHAWPGSLLTAGLVALAALSFSGVIFGLIERMQERTEARNRELLALHQAALDIMAELSLGEVLQRVVDRARELARARYGALAVLGEGGPLTDFITSGLPAEERAAIGAPPQGRGLLGAVQREGRPIRVAEIARDPRSAGFPPNHPPMQSFLGVPIRLADRVIGNLYLTDKVETEEFSAEDEETLQRFAAQAAIAISNARLHERVSELAIVEERERIAREMHDRPAQVLGYVNAKAQAVRELVRAGRAQEAEREVEGLIEQAQAAYADVRTDILALRTTRTGHDFLPGLREYVQRFQEQSGIQVALELPEDGRELGLDPEAELQLGRILQEALTNVRKHAGAAEAVLRLAVEGEGLRGMVAERGRGFDPQAGTADRRPHFGLGMMRERAEAVGGRLTVQSAPGEGTRVLVEIPRRRGKG